MAIDAMEDVAQHLEKKRNAAANNPIPSEVRKETLRAFRNLHSFLHYHSNISKLLWTSKQENKAIMQAIHGIRTKLKLDDDSNTFHHAKRALRDHIEHYDKRVIPLMATTGNMSSFRTCTSKSLSQMAVGTTEENYMRVFVVDTKEYIFQGQVHDLAKMEQDVRNLLLLIEQTAPCPF